MPEERDTNIRAIDRGLQVLTAVSLSKGISPGALAKTLEIPRPSVYRILGALEMLGYVERSATDNRFRVTLKTREISEGYDEETQAGQIGGPVMVALQKKIVWPVDILTYENGYMVIRESTLNRSPMAINRNMIGRNAPMLRTSAGRAWLAFAPEKEREICLNMIRERADPQDAPFLEPSHLNNLLSTCRTQGYGMRLGESLIPETSSFAVPVFNGDHIVCCINVIWITTALSSAEARRTLLDPLREAAAKMELQISEIGLG